ncbi:MULTISPECIES: ATP-binding cassette domain-containing protein [Bacillaceae]|uniref:ATP-binding cassette domain-containing protein n=1 Tax=Cytobacillus firmus TaxID=1399 RepID=A0AA46SJW3_CYTFI|nr:MULTISPECIES: ATP-binding cassette domain-containing protein [Bacillaceae]MCS0652083.1 ATP-binding cassette domain-containing protein [Cytobacillus firmus]MCU1804707.1 ATP-binding cassette domain-containing protein [Cytobacillus firmus]UYG96592.1 ATP-binding cassette domain-containing protein [Cytobacillus firmus]WHY35699.1 ATP-binding cassette domain-containing protein [Cytobacillus firmus]
MTTDLLFAIRELRVNNIINVNHLDIKKDKVTCITGESGAGKSTLLKTLNKMITPDSGEIFYKGTSLKEIDSVQHRRKVIMLSQVPLIFPGTIKDNLIMGYKLNGKKPCDDEILKQALHNMQMTKELHGDAGTLSGGEKQRLALARILLLKADVYLLDEPTSALDEDTEMMILEYFIREIKKKQASLLMITHSNTVNEQFAEERIYLSQSYGQ